MSTWLFKRHKGSLRQAVRFATQCSKHILKLRVATRLRTKGPKNVLTWIMISSAVGSLVWQQRV